MAFFPGDAVPAVGGVKSVSFWAADKQRGPLGTGGNGEVRAPGPLTQQLRETPDRGTRKYDRSGESPMAWSRGALNLWQSAYSPDATVMSVWHSLVPMAEKCWGHHTG